MATHNSVSLSWPRRRKSFKLWSLLAICFYLLSFHQNWHQDIWRDRPRPWDIKLLKSFLKPSSPFPFNMFLVTNRDFFAKTKAGSSTWMVFFHLFDPVISSSLLMVPPSLPRHPVFVNVTLYRLSRGGDLSWEEHNRTDWGGGGKKEKYWWRTHVTRK